MSLQQVREGGGVSFCQVSSTVVEVALTRVGPAHGLFGRGDAGSSSGGSPAEEKGWKRVRHNRVHSLPVFAPYLPPAVRRGIAVRIPFQCLLHYLPQAVQRGIAARTLTSVCSVTYLWLSEEESLCEYLTRDGHF